MAKPALLRLARSNFHNTLWNTALRLEKGIPSIADKSSKTSRAISVRICEQLGTQHLGRKLKGQTSGNEFEIATASFVKETFPRLHHLRPGRWVIRKIGEKDDEPQEKSRRKGDANAKGQTKLVIAEYEQYRHLRAIAKAASENPELAASIGRDYIIKPDVVIFRWPVDDAEINATDSIVDDDVALMTSLRARNGGLPILHASISCKLTIRSDRSQNSRAEGLNLIRNRRGKLPHVVVVTAEPLPSRIASVALGNGDIDCVYHFALPELRTAVKDLELEDSLETLDIMMSGRRLKDIADLPLDLAV